MSQYIAMNRFKIVKGHESDFEKIWKSRNTCLDGSPEFIEFNLMAWT
jgi:heme-degrading monooxygenase HmoA